MNGSVLSYKATVPGNTTATLYLPAASESAVQESGKALGGVRGIAFIKYETPRLPMSFTSGSDEFTVNR